MILAALEKVQGELRVVCRRTAFEQLAPATYHRVDAIYFSPLDTVHDSVFTTNPSTGKNVKEINLGDYVCPASGMNAHAIPEHNASTSFFVQSSEGNPLGIQSTK